MSRKARQFWQPNGKSHPFVNAYCIHAYHAYAYILSHGLPAKLYLHSRIKWRKEASKLRGLEARVAALETKFNFLLQFIRRLDRTRGGEEEGNDQQKTKRDLSSPQPAVPDRASAVPATANPSPTTIYLADQEEDDYACQPEDAYRATAQRLQQRPDLSEGYSPAPRAPKESTEAGTCQYHPGARDHNLQGCEEFKKEVAGLITKGLIRRRGEQPGERLHDNRPAETQPLREDKLPRQGWKELKRILRKFCEKEERRVGETHTSHTTGNMSGPDPVVIRYATKEKVVLQTASVSAVQSSEKVPSVVIQVPQPFPYQDRNLTSGLGGITRSGRCYTPEELEKRRKEAGKAVEDPTKTKAAEEEAADFLRIIKSSEYSIVKQLSKMPSHISVLSLLLASESHRKALLKVLNEAYVPEDITGPSFENMVTSILVTNQLTFSDDELPPEGRGHTKALYISVKTNDRIVSKRETMVTYSRSSTLLPTPKNEAHHRQPIGHHPSRRTHIHLQRRRNSLTLTDVHQKKHHSTVLSLSLSSTEWQAVEPRLSKAGIMVAKEFVKAGFQPGQGLGYANQGRTTIVTLEGNKDSEAQKERNGLRRKMVIPHIRTTFPASAMFQVDEGDVDELALLFTEDLNVNAITTEGDSAAFPVHADQHEEIDLEDFLDEENLKGIHGDPESHLRKYREKMALHTNNEFLMISTFHESLPECAVTWFYQLKNIACWKDLARAFPGPIPPCNRQGSNTTTKAEEYRLTPPPAGSLSISTTTTEEEDSTTTPPTATAKGDEAVDLRTIATACPQVAMSKRYPSLWDIMPQS
uniref:G-patch domain-containing protein n=1 Tax=Fagus sylvatica TaxID=28930 RepID=A0A2N9FM65_FAGSY